MYNPHQLQETLKIQLAIKSTGSVAATEEGLVREQKLQSKNIYQWGKAEAADLSDVSDRLAFLIFKSAELQEAHAKRVAQSRVALKDIVRVPSCSVGVRRTTDTLPHAAQL